MRNSWGFELDTSVARLMYRDDHAWTEVARERIEGPNFAGRLKAMVALIEDDAATDLFLPRSQIVYADVQIDPDNATRQELERALGEHMPHQIGKLDLDWEVTVHGTVRVAAISLETLRQTLVFASALGIRIGKLSTFAGPADFPRSPNFCGRGADVPLSSLIDSVSDDKARKIPGAGIGNLLMPLLGAVGHWIPQRLRAGAMFAVAFAAALGIAALVWTALPPEFRMSEQPLDERPESGLASGTPLAEPDLAASAPESAGTTIDLLRQQPPVVHADARQLAGGWRRGELQAPADDVSITPAPVTKVLALTQPHFPPLPQVEHDAPERVDTANGLLLNQPPVVHADARQLSDLWRRNELRARDDDTGITATPLPTTLVLTQPHVTQLPQAEHEPPERVDTANGLLLQQPPVTHADARQLSDLWRRSELQAPDDDTGFAVAPLPPALALSHPKFPPSPRAEHDAPAHADTANGLLLQKPPAAHADSQQVSDLWRRGELQVPDDDIGFAVAPLPPALALSLPHLPPSPQTGHGAPAHADTAHGLLLQKPPVAQTDSQQVSDLWRRGELQVPDDDIGFAVAPLPPALALSLPHLPPSPQTGHGAPAHVDTAHGLLLQKPPVAQTDSQQVSDLWHRGELQASDDDASITAAPLTRAFASTGAHLAPAPHAVPAAPLVLDTPLPVDHDPMAPAFADRLTPHVDSPSGTNPAFERPAYALRETGDVTDGSVDAAPAPDMIASRTPVPPELLPRMRPDGFTEYVERLKFGGRTLAELATLRAVPRPASAQQLAARPAEPSVAAVGFGSAAPGMRPVNFEAIVAAAETRRRLAAAARAQRALDAARDAQSALVADAEPELPQENLSNRGTPSRSTVATRATIPNAIRLNEVNLVGVYGTTSDRRALVRLPSGRYVRVRVGDRVDGGRVARITESELFYQKGNRTVSLRVPRG